MKKFLIAISMLLCLCGFAGAQQLDSLKRAALDARMSDYLAAIEPLGTDVQKEECDFLIQSCTDSLVRQYVALSLYNSYFGSKVMGSEAVAIHILDNWFITGKVKMPDEIDFLNARIYAEFNRQSLVGMKAPQLEVRDIKGEWHNLFAQPAKRYSVLYFYDTDCSKCKIETILLRNILESEDYPIDFYAFYVGNNEEAWKKYVEDRFDVQTGNTRVTHLWDPELDSDFQRKYGVIQTPRMYLMTPDGKIEGRGLDADALFYMLQKKFEPVELEYGKDESMQLFESIFASGLASEDDIKTLVNTMADTMLPSGDTVMFRQMAGDLLYFLAPKTGSAYKEGLAYLTENYILNRGDIWRTKDDSLKVVGFAEIMNDLLSKARPGKTVADIKVPGVLLKGSKEIRKDIRLNKVGGKNNVIIFHTIGCHICEAEIAAAHKLVAEDKNSRVLLVNVDAVISSSPSLANRLFNAFDLSSLPFILKTDKKGIIQSRYETLQK